MFTGIVEELGTVEHVEDQGDAVRLTIGASLVLEDAHPGDSIAVNGCCLTVVEAGATSFTVSLIPETLARTTLGFRRPGDRVNLETDVIAKHVAKLVAAYLPTSQQKEQDA